MPRSVAIAGGLVLTWAVASSVALASSPTPMPETVHADVIDDYADTVGEGDNGIVPRIGEAVSLPPCEHEDGSGSPLPCLWDAGNSGVNDVGLSFVVTKVDGRLFYSYLDAAADAMYGGF